MKVAAIISEYNPFHNGHEYQIKKLRQILGKDTAVVAIMSGNYMQRGEIAIADKTVRARAAVECGVNLVLELPFPFSMSSAEFFAKSGVLIAEKIAITDYLVFGSESGNVDELSDIAAIMTSDEYILTLETLSRDDNFINCGYPELCQIALEKVYGKNIPDNFLAPNNILALEYLKAISAFSSKITPLAIKREGAGYLDILNPMTEFQSATAIREELLSGNISALDYVPNKAKEVYIEAINTGKMPSNPTQLDVGVISSLRLNSPKADVDIQDASGGLYNRLCDLSTEANSIYTLTAMAETKKYTKARIRRAIWNSFFGVTSSDVKALPCYTQVLAMDSVGRSLLKKIKKLSDFPIITKPSSYKEYGDEIIRQKELSVKADSIYGLSLKNPNSGRFALTFTPYVKD